MHLNHGHGYDPKGRKDVNFTSTLSLTRFRMICSRPAGLSRKPWHMMHCINIKVLDFSTSHFLAISIHLMGELDCVKKLQMLAVAKNGKSSQ